MRGHWRAGGRDIPFAEMDNPYVKNALRWVRNRLRDPISNTYRAELEEKLVELGEEAQRRRLVPENDMTIEQLLGYVAVWQNQYDERQRRNNRMHVIASAPAPQTPHAGTSATDALANAFPELFANSGTRPDDVVTVQYNGSYHAPMTAFGRLGLPGNRTELSVEIPLLQEIAAIVGLAQGSEQRAVALEDERQLDSDL